MVAEFKATIAIDFDGVIHEYSKGWADGTIYDPPKKGAFESIVALQHCGYAVYIHTTRNPYQVVEWLGKRKANRFFSWSILHHDGIGRVPFWNDLTVVAVTSVKLPAFIYIDDRGYRFTDWRKTFDDLKLLLGETL